MSTKDKKIKKVSLFAFRFERKDHLFGRTFIHVIPAELISPMKDNGKFWVVDSSEMPYGRTPTLTRGEILDKYGVTIPD